MNNLKKNHGLKDDSYANTVAEKELTNQDTLVASEVCENTIVKEQGKIDKKPPKGIKQFLTFICFSLGAGIIELSSFAIITAIAKGEKWLVAAEIISVILSCLFNFTLNRKFTFKSASNIYLGMVLYGLYYAVATPLGALAIVGMTRAGVPDILAKIIKMLVNFLLDFSYCKFFIFKIGKKKK